jgi:enoyl-CoA hydratase/carnithine racemase
MGHLSAGHDLKAGAGAGRKTWTVADIYETESRQYVGYSMKWRNVPKPSIAAVQGEYASPEGCYWPGPVI